MRYSMLVAVGCLTATVLLADRGVADEHEDAGRFRPIDVFGLEYASPKTIFDNLIVSPRGRLGHYAGVPRTAV